MDAQQSNISSDIAAYNRILESKRNWAKNHKDELRDYNRQYKLRKRLGGDVLKITKEIEKHEADLVILRQLLTEACEPKQLNLNVISNQNIETKTIGGDGDVLLLVLSNMCHHCKGDNFFWNSIEPEVIQKYSDLKIIKITCPTNAGDGLFSDRHKSFSLLKRWVPTIALLKKNHWNNKDSEINENNTVIFNVDMSSPSFPYYQKYLGCDGFKEWLEIASRHINSSHCNVNELNLNVVPSSNIKTEIIGGDGDVLLLLLSGTCKHSKDLLSSWDTFERLIIQKYPDLKIVKTICPNNTGDGLFSDRHPSFKRLISWFPMVAVFKRDHWNNKDSEINETNTMMLNGNILADRISYSFKYSNTPESFNEWLSIALSNINPLYKTLIEIP